MVEEVFDEEEEVMQDGRGGGTGPTRASLGPPTDQSMPAIYLKRTLVCLYPAQSLAMPKSWAR